jgi:hypothetical protein
MVIGHGTTEVLFFGARLHTVFSITAVHKTVFDIAMIDGPGALHYEGTIPAITASLRLLAEMCRAEPASVRAGRLE